MKWQKNKETSAFADDVDIFLMLENEIGSFFIYFLFP
jgi:hypothetical protein